MTTPKCPSCESTRFKLSDAEVSELNFKHYFIHCSKCGAVIAVLPKTDTNTLIRELQKEVKELKEAVAGLRAS